MFFSNISIRNFKNINNMDIEFHEGINLLIGDNGYGKTAILEAMTIALGVFLGNISGIKKKGIAANQVKCHARVYEDATPIIECLCPTIIDGNIQTGADTYQCSAIRNDQTKSSRTRFYSSELTKYTSCLAYGMKANLPVFCYYSTQRLFPSRREDFGKESRNKLTNNLCGYIGCLDSTLDVKALKAWCLKMTGNKQEKLVSEYESFQRTVSKFMKAVSKPDLHPYLGYSLEYRDIVYTEDGMTLPISFLSAGYQSLLLIIMNMSFRIAQLNPEMSDQADAEGIVLIDDIDMHLHPKWQRKVLHILGELFPKIQFIATTHSPIVISSAKDIRLVSVDENQEITYPESLFAYSANDILELVQGCHSVPEELVDLYKKFDEVLNDEKYDEARRIKDRMAELFGNSNSLVKQAEFELGI